jgi:hypothetical protein
VSNLPERRARHDAVRWPVIAGLTASVTTALTFGALSFFGGFGGAVLAPGQSGPGNPGGGAPPAGAPNAPTVDAVVFAPTGDSLRVLGGTYIGSGGDAHDSTAIQVDTAGGDFASPQYWNVVLGPVETDTVTALDSASVVDIRMRYKGEVGGWSAWDTLAGVLLDLSSPNEPAGFTKLTENPFTVMAPTGWTDLSSDVSIGSDGSAPRSPSGVADARWTAGCGCNPWNLRYESVSHQEVYLHFWLKLDASWVNVPNNNMKIILVGNNNHDDVIVSLNGSGTGAVRYNITTQNVAGTAGIYTQNVTDVIATRDSYDEIEVWLKLDSTPAAEDGEFKIWVNGTLTHDFTGVSLTRTGDNATFDYISVEQSVGGGAVGWPTSEQHQYWDHIYLSGN